MADSAKENSTPNAEPSASGSNLVKVIVKNQFGTITEKLRDPVTNRFVAKPKPMIPSTEFKRAGRKKLAKIREDGLTEYGKAIEVMINRAQYEGNDAKLAQVGVLAFKEVQLALLGKPSMSDDDKEALQTHGIKTVFIDNSIVGTPVQPEKVKEEKKAPSFAEVTQIITNKK
jgi:hypothetical protein